MDRLDRNISPAPACLTVIRTGKPNYVIKGIAWKKKYDVSGNSNDFSWGQYQNIFNSEHIVGALKVISNDHCFYCDINRVRYGIIEPEIDHFCPKTKIPLKAYYYPNLYLSCGSCNRYKSTKFKKRYLLNFDNPNYNFDNYYFIDWTTDNIKVRNDINFNDQLKARYTLLVLGINRDARPTTRREELNIYNNTNNPVINDFSYRFYLRRI